MALPFVDTNVFLRHLRDDHPDFSPRATAYLARVERGELKIRISDTVVFETVYTLERFYKVPKHDIRSALLPLIALPGIVLPGKRWLDNVFSYYVDYNIPFADAYHAVQVERFQLAQIVSFDRDYDKIPGMQRVEP